jgi:hypothetical protein
MAATIQPLQIPEYSAAAPSAFDFAPLAKLGEVLQQKRAQEQQAQSLAALAPQDGAQQGMPAPMNRQAAVPYTSGGNYGGGGAVGGNVQSWYDFARKPLDAGGLGLSHEQAAGKVANLQAESGQNIPSWGPTGDKGTAWGAAQWRNDRLGNLQKFAADRGLDYRSTEAQQGFMRQEYLGPERKAYDALLATRTPQEAARTVDRLYERSSGATTGARETNAARLARILGGQ